MLNKSLPLAVLLAVSTSAGAATIQQVGTDVTFEYDDATLFGVGTVVGNSIFSARPLLPPSH